MTSHRTSSLLFVLALLTGLLSACADQPFSEGAQIAIGVVEESFGDQYTLSAEQLTRKSFRTYLARVRALQELGPMALTKELGL